MAHTQTLTPEIAKISTGSKRRKRLPEIIVDREVSIQIQHHQQDEVGCEGAVEHQQVLAVLGNDNGTGGSFGHCDKLKS